MLDQTTKQKINSLRHILVGKVPDPKSQVDQITNALIYKYMDDMDQQAIALGGKVSFFAGDYEKYSWKNLMDTKIGAQERMNIYTEALEKMGRNKNLSPIFRDILKDAFLPYRSPETLNLFLHEIDGFTYSHSEELGNAFEHLLAIMGSQGDAGQFRTPRHIIDFIVEVVDPQKDDTVLDPACGTAGFLISAYKHICKAHDGIDNKTGKKTNKETPLNANEVKGIHNNFTGYDISPEMVKLSRTNMFLHQFPEPKIFEYDALSSIDRWEDNFDVILANPPFMSPKGGIKPHKKFSVQANRSEVLFVDYILGHLKQKGRAGIIVPEGIIFKSENAYKQLRKALVEDGLWAVVSLPQGVFNPYAGVKTSILLFDNSRAKSQKEICFVKIENDGFNLGAQRREIDKNDLPKAIEILGAWKNGKKKKDRIANWATKKEIAISGDYNLTGRLYCAAIDYSNVKWEMVKLGEVAEINFGKRITKQKNLGTKYPVYGGGGESFRTDRFNRKDECVISRFAMSENCVRFVKDKFWLLDSGGTFSIKEEFDNKILKKFVAELLFGIQNKIYSLARGHAQKNLDVNKFKQIQIPIPPLEVQKHIVKVLRGYQKMIDGIKQVSKNWKPEIKVDPEWNIVKLGEICENLDNNRKPVTKSDRIKGEFPYYGASGIVDYVNGYIFDDNLLLISEDGANLLARSTPIAFSVSGKIWVNNHAHVLKFKNLATQKFIEIYINSVSVADYITGMAQPKLNQKLLNLIEIPLPSLAIQKQIVADIEKEQKAMDKCKEIIEIFEEKIKRKIEEVWGE